MRPTRPVLPLFPGGPAAVASDVAANRGWCSPLGSPGT